VSALRVDTHPEATAVATTTSQDLPDLLDLRQTFFARPAKVVATDLFGCLLVKRQPNGELLKRMIVETEA